MTASGDVSSSNASVAEVHSTSDKPVELVSTAERSNDDHTTREDEDELGDEDDQVEKINIRPEPLKQHLASPMEIEAGLQLIELCREGNVSAVEQQTRAGAPAGFITKTGWTPVAAAAYSGFNEVLLYLLEIGADAMYETSTPSRKYQLGNGHVSSSSFAKETNGNTPLHWACYKGHADTVSLLLAAGYNPEVADSTGNRCLHLACSGGQRDVVEQLLAHSAAVEPRNKYGNRPLDLATDPACRRLLTRYQAQTSCEWCKESFSRLRRPSLCQQCHNVFCDTKPCSSSFTPSPHIPTEGNESKNADQDSSVMLAQARSMRYCQECATEMGKAEQDLRNVLESKLELIRRTLAVLDPSMGQLSKPTLSAANMLSGGDENLAIAEGALTPLNDGETASSESIAVVKNLETPIEDSTSDANSIPTLQKNASRSSEVLTPVNLDESFDNDQNSSRSARKRRPPSTATILSALTLTQTDAEALYTTLEAAQLKAADVELLRLARQTYRQLVAHVALQEEVKALLAVRPIGIRSLLEPLKRALQHATRDQVHQVMLLVALQVLQSAEAECTLFGCQSLCEKIGCGSRRYSKDIARLEASLAEAQVRSVSDKLLIAACALRDRLNAEVRLEVCLMPFKAPAPGTLDGFVFSDGSVQDTLLHALEHRTQLVSTAVDNGSAVKNVSLVLLEEANVLLKQLKKEVRDETKAEDERRKAEEEAALKAAKKGKKKNPKAKK